MKGCESTKGVRKAFPSEGGELGDGAARGMWKRIPKAAREWKELYELCDHECYPNGYDENADACRVEPYVLELTYLSALGHFVAARESESVIQTALGRAKNAAKWEELQVSLVTFAMRLFSSVDALAHLDRCIKEHRSSGCWNWMLNICDTKDYEKLQRKSHLNVPTGIAKMKLFKLRDLFRNRLTHGLHPYLVPVRTNGRSEWYVLRPNLAEVKVVQHRKLRMQTVRWDHVLRDCFPQGSPMRLSEITEELMRASLAVVTKVGK